MKITTTRIVAPALLLAIAPLAQAQHLWWSATYQQGKKERKIEKMTFLYGEIEVLRSGPTIYYCGVNWQPGRPAGGYCGIQDHTRGRRCTIFSVWDTSKNLHPRTIAWDERTSHGRFGGEGEGGHTHLDYPWKEKEVFRFAVTKRPDATGKSTLVTFYFFDRILKKWVLEATISSPGSNLESVRWFGGSMNSFLENWSGRKRDLPKLCLYRLWAGTSARDLHFLRKARGDGVWGILRGSYFLAEGDRSLLEKILAREAEPGKKALVGERRKSLPLLPDRKLPAALLEQLETLPPPTEKTPPSHQKSRAPSLADEWQWVGPVVVERGYHIWGGSPIIGPAGRVHLFVARWPIAARFDPGWRTHSEIAHYVGAGPKGPFHFAGVVARGDGEGWDASGHHNPAIRRIGKRYALVYISNPGIEGHPANQRIGLMVADSLDGPWRKLGRDGLVLAPDPRGWNRGAGNGVNNPALIQAPDGRFLLYFKSTDTRPGKKHHAVMGVAIADRLGGPYVIQPEPITRNDRTIEDGTAFTWKGRIRLLTTDNHGILERGGGLLWSSSDGIHFEPEPTPGFHRIAAYLPAGVPPAARRHYGPRQPKLERPQILVMDGQPAYLYAPSGTNLEGSAGTCLYLLERRPSSGEGRATPAPKRIAVRSRMIPSM